ncbi:MAG: tRNA (adenosine(37)-N6)-threonylcarbamoyltransferase complex dimerization subunit type 1 TsaB [Phycisphaerae bacterium]
MIQPNARILAMDTAGRAGSVALGCPEGMLRTATLPGEMRHAAELLPAIHRLLSEQGWAAESLTHVFISIGPGSFTGLRLGVSVARTLAWSIGARVVAVPTMDMLGRNAMTADPVPEHVATILDAKRGQVFAAAYSICQGEPVRIIDAHLSEPLTFLNRCPRPLAVLGEGLSQYAELAAQAGARVLPAEFWPGRAEHVLTLGLQLAAADRYTPVGDLLPLYIRRPEPEEKWEARHGAQL